MYCRAKPSREENQKPKKCHRNTPSFSSTLLDEIYRSIDGGGNPEKAGAEINPGSHREKPATGLRSNNGGRRSSTGNHHEQTAAARFSRGCLARNNDKELSFGSTAKSEVSNCPYSTNPNCKPNPQFMEEDGHHLTKSKSRALKVYTKLKKMKQPISPGKRLTNFINSLFTNLNSNNKKIKKQDPKQQSSKVTSSSTPSSSTTSPSSRLRKHTSSSIMRNNDVGINQPMVRFHPVCRPVSEDQDSPCRPKSIVYDNDRKLYGRPPLPPNALARNRNINKRRSDFSMFEEIEDDEDEDEDEDGVSDSSSDLFELDHLVLFGNTNIFCQELPVYETTYFDNNRAVAAGLFCN